VVSTPMYVLLLLCIVVEVSCSSILLPPTRCARVGEEDDMMFPVELRSCDIDDVFEAPDRAKAYRPLFLTMQQFLAKCSPSVQAEVAKHVTFLGSPLCPTTKPAPYVDRLKGRCVVIHRMFQRVSSGA
jgi:hypothetical protein